MFFFSSKPAACEWRVRTCFLKARFRAFDNRLTSLLGKINRKIEHVLQGQCHGRSGNRWLSARCPSLGGGVMG